MSPLAILIVLGIASIAWFGFLRKHLAGKSGGSGDGSGDGSGAYSSDSGHHRDHDSGGHDSGSGGDGGGGDGGGE